MLLVDILCEAGDQAECIILLAGMAAGTHAHSAELMQDIAQRYTMLGMHVEAEQCQSRSCASKPDKAEYLYNHATALIALGRLDEAEALLDKVIEMHPGDSDAWYNRSTLRRQTAQGNHVAKIESRIAATPASSPGAVALHYALAKELEDVGQSTRSFQALRQGADARRRLLRYRVEDDAETMRLITDAFDAYFFRRPHHGHEDARPLFIVGLPRSGTTLVDRILSSHGAVLSRGETSDMAVAMVKCAGDVVGKAQLVERSTTLDFKALGELYCRNLKPGPALRQLDKTPINFLYMGLIAAALPNARVIHLRRNPMDACYAMYKTLFRMAYPFSYDLADLGRYWLEYDRMMNHWRQVFPQDRLLEIDYEDLVVNQEDVSRRLVTFAGLEWEPACLSFERNAQPSLTASAAQVRQPMYQSSIGLWRRYSEELMPLRDMLAAAGIPIDDEPAGLSH